MVCSARCQGRHRRIPPSPITSRLRKPLADALPDKFEFDDDDDEIGREKVANHDILRYGLHAVKGDFVVSHPLRSLRDTTILGGEEAHGIGSYLWISFQSEEGSRCPNSLRSCLTILIMREASWSTDIVDARP